MRYLQKALPACAATLYILASATSVPAAELFESFDNWHVRAVGEGKERVCWVVSEPTKWRASKKNVRRGEIYLAVSFRPGDGVEQEVNFHAGYPLKERSRVAVQVGGRNLEMPTYRENAWGADPQEDVKLVRAFEKGRLAVVQGVSTRGTRTTDTFSLIGFTAALRRAKEACGA